MVFTENQLNDLNLGGILDLVTHSAFYLIVKL